LQHLRARNPDSIPEDASFSMRRYFYRKFRESKGRNCASASFLGHRRGFLPWQEGKSCAKLCLMPPMNQSAAEITLNEVVETIGVYPLEAYEFVQRGLSHTVTQIHGKRRDPDISMHVTGQQLCEGLRDFALSQWGLLARAVLARWNITSTWDFGRIVFAMVDNGLMQKTDEDTIDDFRNVFDFKTAFDAHYRIEIKA